MEFKLLVGQESKAFLVDLEAAIARLEKTATRLLNSSGKVEAATEEEETTETEEEDEDFTTKKGKKTSSFEEEDETETEDEEEDATPKKAAKTKKVTLDDVQDACKAKVKSLISELIEDGKSRADAGAEARQTVVKLLKKKFGTPSVTALETDQYADVIKVMTK